MAWDNTMPLDFSNGQLVDEGDLDPIVTNLASLEFATVFLGGQRRTTGFLGIGGTEQVILTTPSATLEGGYLHKVEGVLKWTVTGGSGGVYRAEVKLREGTTTAGTVLLSWAVDATTLNQGRTSPFSQYVKTGSTIAQRYCLTMVHLFGTSANFSCDIGSQIGILRSGDNALMSDI